MTPRTLLGLAIITVITTGAAVWVTLQQPAASAVQIGDEPAFPALRERPDAVAKVIITTPTGTITLVRAEDHWVTPDRYDYPIAADKLRELIVQLADMRLIEAKTRRPDRYARLEVEDVTDDAGSRLVRIEDTDGAVLAEAILGKRRQRLTGTEPAGTYLRHPGEEQSWLASGGIDLDEQVQDWLEQEIVALPADTVRRIEIHPPSGEAYAVVRDAQGAELRLDRLAAGETPKEDANLNQLAGALAAVRLEDVKPAGELDWPQEEHTVRVATFDGIDLTLRLATLDDQHWLQLDAAPGEQAAEQTATATEKPAAEETPAEEIVAADQPATAEERARAIDARAEGWAYQIGDFLFGRLTKPREDWLEQSGTS